MLKQGISIIAVVALIVSWVTVGMIQLPFEIKTLGKKFAVTRNIVSFLLAILMAIVLSITMVIL